MKKLVLGLLATHMLFATAIRADDETQHRRCHHHKKCDEIKGNTYRSEGPNTAPQDSNVFIVGPLIDKKGCQVGTITDSATSNPTVFKHVYKLNDGGVLDVQISLEGGIFADLPIDANVALALPETAPYIGNPNAFVRLLAGDTAKDSPAVVSWIAKGSLRRVNFLSIRCSYLFLNGRVIKSLNCEFFLGKAHK